jgi:HD-like signal output (HDOD) protein
VPRHPQADRRNPVLAPDEACESVGNWPRALTSAFSSTPFPTSIAVSDRACQSTMPENPVEKGLASLPALPLAVAQLLALDSNSDQYPEELTRVVEGDPSLAVRLMSLANSAESAPEQPIRSIPQAMARLGVRRAGQVFLSMTFMRVFAPKSEGQLDLWRHALQVAVASREIARASGWGISPHEAYLVGLLHDLGRFVMFECCPERLRGIEESGGLNAHDLIEMERQACGNDHCELGWRACKSLAIPTEISELVRLHHSPVAETQALPAPRATLLRTVQQADLLSGLLLRGPSPFDCEPEERVSLLARTCVVPEWDWAPVSAGGLERLLDPIIAYSNKVMLSVGVGVIRQRRTNAE